MLLTSQKIHYDPKLCRIIYKNETSSHRGNVKKKGEVWICHRLEILLSCISFSLLIQIDLFCVKKQMPKPPPINFFSKTVFIFRSRQNMLNFQMLLKRIQAFFFFLLSIMLQFISNLVMSCCPPTKSILIWRKKKSVNIIIFFHKNKQNKQTRFLRD